MTEWEPRTHLRVLKDVVRGVEVLDILRVE